MKDREITPNVLDRLIAVAEENITKTRARTPNRSDRIREMQQTTQALQEFRLVMQERDESRARVAKLEAITHARHALTCGWREDDDGNWQTSCGEVYVFIEGNPTENDYRYCPGCGKPITIIQPKG